jgi:hypothetical protein
MAQPDIDPGGFPQKFLAALGLIAEAAEAFARAGQGRPVLVGGAAVELWTTGRYLSGDFDLVAADPAPIESALIERGFRREDRRGHIVRGLYHPALGMGVEIVSGQLLDGRADRTRLVLVNLGDDKRVLVIPPEDVIADRLGQQEAASRSDRRQLALARLVYAIADEIDEPYLLRRVREETGSAISAEQLKELLADDRD